MDKNQKLITVVLLMVVGAFARLIPHIPNFTPIESLTIFGAAYLGRKQWAIVAPLVILYISDFIINNTVARSFFPDVEGIVWFDSYMIFNVLAIIAIVLFSSSILQKVNIKNILISILGASVIFFIITNFGSWASEKSIYTNDLSGLLTSYTAGLPFFRTSLLSNLVFSGILFGSYEIIIRLVRRKAALDRV